MPASRARWTGALAWLIPIIAIVFIYDFPRHWITADRAVSYLLALGLVALAVQRPDRSLLILIVLFPFQGLLLAKLWSWGLPVSVVKHLGAWKETLAIGVFLAGVRASLASPRRPEWGARHAPVPDDFLTRAARALLADGEIVRTRRHGAPSTMRP